MQGGPELYRKILNTGGPHPRTAEHKHTGFHTGGATHMRAHKLSSPRVRKTKGGHQTMHTGMPTMKKTVYRKGRGKR